MMLLWVAEALARVGGGQDYSSGSGGDGGGGGGGDIPFELIRLLLWLCIEHPLFGIPLTIFVIWLWITLKAGPIGGKVVMHGRAKAPRPAAGAPLSGLRSRDPAFSALLFQDLAQLVYLRAWTLRGGQTLSVPYLSPPVARALTGEDRVQEVVVGGLEVVGLRQDQDRDRITVVYEANARVGETWFYLRERWVWSRLRTAQTPSPAAMRLRACPSCGNPMDTTSEGACRSCDTPLSDGRLNWVVEQVATLDRRPLEPPGRQSGPEVGTDLPTRFDPNLERARRAFRAAHPDFDEAEFRRRAEQIFATLQTAWSAGAWQSARPLETESLFHSHNLVLQRYQRAGLRNRCEDLRILRFELVKIEQDAWYDAITTRIRAELRDWTEDAGGAVVSGSQKKPRVFSEYWTFARAAQPSDAASHALDRCPSCGAPLDKLGFGGVCGYCETNVVGGERDWVLARIEQDELYGG